MNTKVTPRRALLALALPAALALGACSKGDDAAAGDSAAGGSGTAAGVSALLLGPQDVAVAREGDVGAGITVSGPLEPKEAVTIRAQVGGTMRNLRVDRGSAVSRGQRLATIQAAGVQSQAAGAQAQVAAAQAGLAVARQRRDAAVKLRAAGAMSEIDMRSAVAQFEAAEAQVAAARAQAAGAGEAAGFTTIEAPISGIVSERFVEDGEAVSPGGQLLTVVNSRTLELEGQVGVAEAGRVRAGQAVTFTLDAMPDQEFTGRVARVDPVADPGTRQVGVYVELANAGGRIVGGQFARGRIATGTSSVRGVLIPETAVLRASPQATSGRVFVIEAGRLVAREVTLGARDESTGLVVAQSGVRAGEQLIAVPTSEVKEGTRVTLAADGGTSVPATATGTARSAPPAGARE
jgi:RND family efflux transporter MFP subunit